MSIFNCLSRIAERSLAGTALCLACAGAHGQATEAPASGWTELLVAVELNGQPVSEAALVQRRDDGELFVADSDLQRWKLKLPSATPSIGVQGVPSHPLSSLPIRKLRLDGATQTLTIEVKPEAFAATTLDASSYVRPAPTPSALGGFLNYDLSAQHDASGSSRYALIEAGGFARAGGLISRHLFRDTPSGSDGVRLDTTWTTDLPDQLASLRLGDAITQAGAWGNAVRFGGVQFATNFATQPGFVTVPLQTVSGAAVLPSTVDVYVNNALAAQRQVPPGPFSIRDLPVVSGSGQVTLVVRDLLGREQVITQAFTSSVALLRAGLTDYSFEAGAVRNDYGIASNHYGPGVISATVRHGLTDRITAEAHGEHSSDVSDGGVAGAWLIDDLVTVTPALAVSRRHDSIGASGHLVGLGIDRATTGLSATLRWQQRSRDFTRVGDLSGQPAVHDSLDGTLSRAFGAYGSLGIAYAARRYYDAADTRVASLDYSLSLGNWGFLGASVLRTLSAPRAQQVNVFWSIPLGRNTHASIARQPAAEGGNEWVAGVQANPTADVGWSWLAQASDHGNGRAQTTYQGNSASVSGEVERLAGSTNTRVGAQGGIGVVGGSAFLSRSVTDSFALVRVPDMPGVRVYANNLEAGRTDDQGEIVLPHLRPYERNTVAVEQLDLGLDTEIRALSVDVVPYYRSGLVVDFPVRRTRSATLRLRLGDGSALPSDAQVRVDHGERVFPVGFDGEVYLSDLTVRSRVEAQWAGRRCSVEVVYPAGRDPVPDLGERVCMESTQ